MRRPSFDPAAARIGAAVERLPREDRELLALLLLEHLTPDEAGRALREPVRIVRRRAASALARLAQVGGLLDVPPVRRAA